MAASLSGGLAMPRGAKLPMHWVALPIFQTTSIVISDFKFSFLSAERGMSCLYEA